ncbi:hypothetical protein [Streptococcus gallolyticus]|uniref:hypothetical protein n=1 Tax=Streptococcus gallolyticus TaxID=315405 RepID=UPI000883DECA|nr:hypothetical protein [Streptococcus gallolyticus]SDK24415.1 hypothetical protein SAMN04487842_1899 [Streptococcus gallolyticus]SDL71644.1 hypothetical protein SAMN04487841_1842 [Streptococcus gallolyticus]
MVETHTHINRKNVFILYACLILFIILMGIDIFLGKSLSNGVSKLLLCTSCLAILGMIIAGYRYECDKFAQIDDLIRLRTLGVSINPHSRLGKIGYGLAIVLIITILVIILLAL